MENKSDMNQSLGQTVTARELPESQRSHDPLSDPSKEAVLGERNVLGNTFAEIAREGSIEYRQPATSNLPEAVSTQTLLDKALQLGAEAQ
jgi:hypothetical protein